MTKAWEDKFLKQISGKSYDDLFVEPMSKVTMALKTMLKIKRDPSLIPTDGEFKALAIQTVSWGKEILRIHKDTKARVTMDTVENLNALGYALMLSTWVVAEGQQFVEIAPDNSRKKILTKSHPHIGDLKEYIDDRLEILKKVAERSERRPNISSYFRRISKDILQEMKKKTKLENGPSHQLITVMIDHLLSLFDKYLETWRAISNSKYQDDSSKKKIEGEMIDALDQGIGHLLSSGKVSETAIGQESHTLHATRSIYFMMIGICRLYMSIANKRAKKGEIPPEDYTSVFIMNDIVKRQCNEHLRIIDLELTKRGEELYDYQSILKHLQEDPDG